MKRDPELIRQLLLSIESQGVPGIMGRDVEVEGYSTSQILAHLNMLADAGFIVGEYSRSRTNPERIIVTEIVFDLSWAGHEYLDLVRDEEVWRETKRLSKKAGASSVEFLMEIAKAVATNTLRQAGLPI